MPEGFRITLKRIEEFHPIMTCVVTQEISCEVMGYSQIMPNPIAIQDILSCSL
jgi:hypothetical protein